MNTDKAIASGLLPEAFREKVQTVGNSCIVGMGGLRENAEDAVKNLAESAAEIELNRKTDADNLYKCLISLPSCSTIRHVRKYQPH